MKPTRFLSYGKHHLDDDDRKARAAVQVSNRAEIDVGGRLGTTKAEGTFEIRGEDDGAVVAFAGDARLKGVLARMGGRVLTGVARQFTRQFFEALEKEV